MIDVERLLMSPIAMKEKWRDKVNSSQGESLHFPIDAVRYLLASKLDFVSDFEDIWDAALIETVSDVSLPYMSKMEGGYLDTLEGQQVAFSPRNAFFVSFKPTILGVSFPANRQDLGRWLRKIQSHEDPQVSEYLQKAVQLAHGKDHVVVAFDLGDLFTSRQIRDRLRGAESLAGKDVDLDALTKVLTSMKGVTLTVNATDRLTGKIQVDFGESPSPLKPVAKALLFESLEKHGMMLDSEIQNWAVRIEAKAVTLEGRLSTRGLRMLTDLIPFPAETLALHETSPKSQGTSSESVNSSSPEELKITTSKKYFQHVSLLIDSLRTEVKSAGSPKLARTLVNKAALEIDRMPVLNVDEELIAYGAGVSQTLRNMRNLSKNAGLDASYRQATAAGNQGYGFYGGYGGTSLALQSSVMQKQMNATLASNQLSVLTMLEEKTAEIRRKMTLKYKVEF